jgi:NLI interacting factor-like phosphatase
MLLVLDLDETLVYATERPLCSAPDFGAGPYHVYRRPHLEPFLRSCAALFDVGFWSSGSAAYVARVVPAILPAGVSPVLAWSGERCVRRFDPDTRKDYHVKDLRKLARAGYDLARVLAVDDTRASWNGTSATRSTSGPGTGTLTTTNWSFSPATCPPSLAWGTSAGWRSAAGRGGCRERLAGRLSPPRPVEPRGRQ